jgi:phenylalanyl-tRNA synthetase beta chain
MKFTFNWLKEYIDPGLPPGEVAARLTMAGLEVDSVQELFAGLDTVKVARVLAVTPHPGADRLTLCRVAVGSEELQVVCGAANVHAGMLTAIALPGTRLPSGLVIKKSKIRGEQSNGMLCSEKELGLSEEAAGIMELPAQLESGAPLVEALGLRDTLIEVDLTPNRPDCASVLGIAREVGGFTGARVVPPLESRDLSVLDGRDIPFSVEVQDAIACPRYAARLLTGIKLGPSPWWLRRRLQAVGVRPINNVVDVTNYVMLEYGQPLHAFDYEKLAGGRIVVRQARAGETIATLDGIQRGLNHEMLLICDADKPVAVAGVMGGENSEVSEGTTKVLLESASFQPVSIRRTARMLKMSTEASWRFERGTDPQGVVTALERAVRLLEKITGARAVAGGIDRREPLKKTPAISLRVKRTNDLLGTTYSREEMARALNAIEIAVEEKDDDTLLVRPPSFRVDLEREVDLMEEVARLQGYNAIPTTLPLVSMRLPERDRERDLRRKLAGVMVSQGFSEAINYSFVTAQHCDLLGLAGDDSARAALVRLLNPLGEEQSVLRTTLLPGLLENIRHNINRQNTDLRLFEIGKGFFFREEAILPMERQRLVAAACGRRYPGAPLLHAGEAAVDIYDIKGTVELILSELGLPQVRLEPDPQGTSYAAPGSLVRLWADDREAGQLGQIAAGVCKAFGVKQEVYFLDLDLDCLLTLSPVPKSFRALPRFPAVKRDAAFLVAENVGGGEMLAAIRDLGEPLIERTEIFDVYSGKPIAPGQKSVAIAITYRAADKTLDDETAGRVQQRVIDMIIDRFQAKLREA